MSKQPESEVLLDEAQLERRTIELYDLRGGDRLEQILLTTLCAQRAYTARTKIQMHAWAERERVPAEQLVHLGPSVSTSEALRAAALELRTLKEKQKLMAECRKEVRTSMLAEAATSDDPESAPAVSASNAPQAGTSEPAESPTISPSPDAKSQEVAHAARA
ncbi:MAG: hypothetical protein KDB90_08750 [Planctomycetes bacterium]|nr:hypothetical protein [Planctomycetota bacterium]